MTSFLESHYTKNKKIEIDDYIKFVSDIRNKKKYKKTDKIPAIKFQGQIKLLISELIFFNYIDIYNLENIVIIYAGAAPFIHGFSLIKLLPNVNWILIDPNKFVSKLFDYENVKIINDYLTIELAKQLKIENIDKNIIFISDIRTSLETDNEPNTNDIIFNQNLNNDTVIILDPLYSYLKFRFPFPDNYKNIIYNKGLFFIQLFSKDDSIETRLFVDKNNNNNFIESTYEQAIEYEQKLFYYNTEIKFCKLNKQLDWFCNCYQCGYLIEILKELKVKRNIDEDIKSIFNKLFIFKNVF